MLRGLTSHVDNMLDPNVACYPHVRDFEILYYVVPESSDWEKDRT